MIKSELKYLYIFVVKWPNVLSNKSVNVILNCIKLINVFNRSIYMYYLYT